jgi:hypothetical protein
MKINYYSRVVSLFRRPLLLMATPLRPMKINYYSRVVSLFIRPLPLIATPLRPMVELSNIFRNVFWTHQIKWLQVSLRTADLNLK